MTQLEIFNMALGLIGHDRTIPALPSTSTEAVRCSLFWESARRAVLGKFDWQWLTIDTASTSAATQGNDGITYIHNLPAGMLRLVNVRSATGIPLIHKMTGGKIIVDAATIIISHVSDSTDPTGWPAQITDAIVAELAARICAPMKGDFKMAADLHAQAGFYMQEAAKQNGSEQAAEQEGE